MMPTMFRAGSSHGVKRKTPISGRSIRKTSRASKFNEQAGEPEFAAALDGTSPYDVRAPVLDRFKRGEIQVLVNCSLFTEGFDVPQIALVAIARPVLSRSFYAQMVGRGTRLSDGKRDLLVLDFVPINCRHSLAHAVDIFTSVDEEVREQARAGQQTAAKAQRRHRRTRTAHACRAKARHKCCYLQKGIRNAPPPSCSK